MRAAVVADMQEPRLAGDPVLYGIAVAHDERHIADALGKARMRLAWPLPAFIHQPMARHHVGTVLQPVLGAARKFRPRMHMAVHHPPPPAEREFEQWKQWRRQLARILRGHVGET